MMRHALVALLLILVAAVSGCGIFDNEGMVGFKPVPDSADGAPSWSNSGDRIVYVSFYDSSGQPNVDLYLTDTTGIPKTPIDVPGASARWLPGDSELVINPGFFSGGSLLKLNLNTGLTTQLSIPTVGTTIDVSNHGQFIYYTGPMIDSQWSEGIHQFNIAIGLNTPLVAGSIPAVSPDGGKIAFTRQGLYVYDIQSAAILKLFSKGRAEPDWTPDGNYLVFRSADSILKVDLLGNAQLLARAAGEGGVSVSPDGKKILLCAESPDFRLHLWIMNIDGTGLRQFTF